MAIFPFLLEISLLFLYPILATSAPNLQDALLITPPPIPEPTHCPSPNLLKRQLSCTYGQCGDNCLSQGAFCCGPAGTLATSPYWVCDNGACITSVRGSTGIVDCYDPDNPSGTTQSCHDHGATSSCSSTDRCFTCDTDVPYCHWETWIDKPTNSPTLKWFSCIESRIADATIFAANITIPSQTNPSTSTTTSTSTSPSGNSSPLSTGAIIGIAVGAGIAIIGAVAILLYCCFKKRQTSRLRPQELSAEEQNKQTSPPPMIYQPPVELDVPRHDRSELGSTTAYSPHSQISTPFTPHDERYAQNVEEIDMWRRGMDASELPTKMPSYMEQPSRELYGDAGVRREVQDPRDSWGRGDDLGHMSPGGQTER
ncbi:uncharacterized protein BDR25DRAFT_31470 [Lindgomyces ingoldianus]|uniref:Uncharacterized protein n=1 Tax=Lindgomyces ingoldianus TaxID=673940 RepID=A0ACB6QUN0_9PLEO|nr:uncharacterized protein BDR25DRAFT_31470 [Lindgomyces ingoldianus]KAF2470641.1 hypothetical protein BDR25DRAFT_31470 [Lindgomyces ingoldianus]